MVSAGPTHPQEDERPGWLESEACARTSISEESAVSGIRFRFCRLADHVLHGLVCQTILKSGWGPSLVRLNYREAGSQKSVLLVSGAMPLLPRCAKP